MSNFLSLWRVLDRVQNWLKMTLVYPMGQCSLGFHFGLYLLERPNMGLTEGSLLFIHGAVESCLLFIEL